MEHGKAQPTEGEEQEKRTYYREYECLVDITRIHKLTVGIATALCRFNPEEYRAYSYLKEVLSENMFFAQMNLTRFSLTLNHKSYVTWFHRKFLMRYAEKKFSPNEYNEILRDERKLTKMLLGADGRNYHCWNYKNDLFGLDAELSLNLVRKDLANNSAYHTLLLYHFSDGACEFEGDQKRVGELPLSLFLGIVCTAPDVESPWEYYESLQEMHFFRDSKFYLRAFLGKIEVVFKRPFAVAEITVETWDKVPNMYCVSYQKTLTVAEYTCPFLESVPPPIKYIRSIRVGVPTSDGPVGSCFDGTYYMKDFVQFTAPSFLDDIINTIGERRFPLLALLPGISSISERKRIIDIVSSDDPYRENLYASLLSGPVVFHK